MTDKIILKTGVALSLLLLLILCSFGNKKKADDKPTCSMFMGDGSHAEKYDSPSVKKEPTTLWKVKMQDD